MSYLGDVLALHPSLHWPLSESDDAVQDATGNGYHASMISQSGVQYVRRVESLVRSAPFEPSDLATLMNTALSATTGVGRIFLPALSSSGLPTTGSYTIAVWGRWKGATNSICSILGRAIGGEVSLIEFWMFGANTIRLDHVDPDGMGGFRARSFDSTGLVRPDSRHFFVARFDADAGEVSVFVDGAQVGAAQAQTPINAAFSPDGIYVGDTELSPQRPWRHYLQHYSYWAGTALTDAQILALWNAGKTKPGRTTGHVDFGEEDYSDGVSVIDAGHWDRVFNSTVGSPAVAKDSAEAVFGGRVLDMRTTSQISSLRWLDAFREPLQRFTTRLKIIAGFNESIGFVMLGGWDYTSQGDWGAGPGSGIEVRLHGDTIQLIQRIFGVTTTLASAPFVRALGDWVQMRGEINSLTLEVRARAWHDADPEPDTWDVESSIHAAFQGGDGFFAVQMLEANTTGDIDYINLEYNSGDPPPPFAMETARKAWAFTMDGHIFYVLASTDTLTLLYDLMTGQWCVWRTGALTYWNMHRGTMWRGRAIAADAELPVIWEIAPDTMLDEETMEISRVVTGIQPVRGDQSIRQGSMRLRARRQGDLGDPAEVSLRYSDDGGNTWSTPRTITLDAGDVSKKVEFRSLGRLRKPGRVWEISDSGALIRIDGLNSVMDGS